MAMINLRDSVRPREGQKPVQSENGRILPKVLYLVKQSAKPPRMFYIAHSGLNCQGFIGL